MSAQISIVIPVYNAAAMLERCLDAITWATPAPLELIVVDDASTDGSGDVARRYGAQVLQTEHRGGPARARNLGARVARGDILLFIDADVRVHPHTIARVGRAFAADAELDALIGSYDDKPAATGFVSQYKNLRHSFVHQTSSREASTFFSGCGAIRREVLLAHGGFDESYDRPTVEDIELGYRLTRAGRNVVLDPDLLVNHMKRWTLLEMIRSDVRDRALPWSELILRDRSMPNDLNLRTGQRVSAMLTFLLLGVLPLLALELLGVGLGFRFAAVPVLSGIALASFVTVLALNGSFYRFLAGRRGVRFALAAIPLQLLYHLYSGASLTFVMARHSIRALGAPLEAPDAREEEATESRMHRLAFPVGETSGSAAEPVRARSARGR